MKRVIRVEMEREEITVDGVDADGNRVRGRLDVVERECPACGNYLVVGFRGTTCHHCRTTWELSLKDVEESPDRRERERSGKLDLAYSMWDSYWPPNLSKQRDRLLVEAAQYALTYHVAVKLIYKRGGVRVWFDDVRVDVFERGVYIVAPDVVEHEITLVVPFSQFGVTT